MVLRSDEDVALHRPLRTVALRGPRGRNRVTRHGTVISTWDDRHRHQEWLQFDLVTPAGKNLHLIADNYGTHKHAKGAAVVETAPAMLLPELIRKRGNQTSGEWVLGRI